MVVALVLVCVGGVLLLRSGLGTLYSRRTPESKVRRLGMRYGDAGVLIRVRRKYFRWGLMSVGAGIALWLILLAVENL